MCGIIGIIGKNKAAEKVIKGLNIIKDRGKDNYGVYDFSNITCSKRLSSLDLKKVDKSSKDCIGHCLHSIVSIVPQPIKKDDSYIIINCEIYNWKELCKKYDIDAKNDAELVLLLILKKGLKNILETLELLDGVYSFCMIQKNSLYLARDILGVKPLFYSFDKGLSFCSEKKALEKQGIKGIEELNPRQIIRYDIKSKRSSFLKRDFFKISPEHKKSYDKLKKEVKGLIISSISKRVPDQKVGVLFSGGVDSTLIALILKQLGVPFTCYTAGFYDGNMQEPKDIIASKKIAKKYGFKLKINKVSLKKAKKYIKKVCPLIEDNTVVKVGVGLTFYCACEIAKKDKVRVIFSGLGAEEIFAGYERHKKSSNVNKECVSGLLKMYERDLYRDDTITMNNNIELRLAFLDKELVRYALRIPGKYKLNDEQNKIILRDCAQELGLDNEFSQRKKIGAQYGSKFSRAIQKLAKIDRSGSKALYLSEFYQKPNVKLAALISGGKDGLFAAYLMHVHNYKIECIITIKSKNKDSYMYHTPNIDMVDLQSEALGVPLISKISEGKKEKELGSLRQAIKEAKDKHNVQGIVSGAIFSQYQRERIDNVCEDLGIKNFVPLWHMDQELEMRQLLKNNFEVIISSIAADGLDKSYLGKKIDEDMIDKLKKVSKKVGLNIAGEGGEFESLVLDCPLFKKKIDIIDSEIMMENKLTGHYKIKKAGLIKKDGH